MYFCKFAPSHHLPSSTEGADEPTRTAGGLTAYGGLYEPATQLLSLAATGEPMQVGLREALPMRRLAARLDNTLTVEESGDYELSFNLLMAAKQNADIGFGARRNGEVMTNTQGRQTLTLDTQTGSAYDGRLSVNTLVQLWAGDVIDLAVWVLKSAQEDLEATIAGNANAVFILKKLDNR